MRVVEAGSFSEAARRMRTSRSVVSKAVARLEKSLGARLLNRTTRHLSLTEIGSTVAAYCGRMLEEADEIEQLVESLNFEPQGTLCECVRRVRHTPCGAVGRFPVGSP